jgi:hypothetical protein
MVEEALSAGVGTHVVIELLLVEGVERLEFDLVTEEAADFHAGFLSVDTPLGQAILGEKPGITVPYFSEDTLAIRLLEVGPARLPPPAGLQARRQENLRKAIDASDRTNAMLFASSFSGKWGDYDPSGFIEETPGPDQEG